MSSVMGSIVRQLQARRADIARQIERLQTEDSELAIAERALSKFEQQAPAKASKSAAPKSKADKPQSKLSAKGANQLRAKSRANGIHTNTRAQAPNFRNHSLATHVVDALRGADDPWMDFPTLVRALNRKREEPVAENSLRVLLSTLKRKQVIVRQGRLVALAERGASRSNDR